MLHLVFENAELHRTLFFCCLSEAVECPFNARIGIVRYLPILLNAESTSLKDEDLVVEAVSADPVLAIISGAQLASKLSAQCE